MKEFKTEYQKKKEQMELALYQEYQQLVSNGGSKTEIIKYLCKKYGIAAPSTFYAIKKRIEGK